MFIDCAKLEKILKTDCIPVSIMVISFLQTQMYLYNEQEGMAWKTRISIS